MPTLAPERTDELVLRWLSDESTGWDHPAGPLFPSSDYAPAEITMTGPTHSRCSSCTASSQVQCC